MCRFVCTQFVQGCTFSNFCRHMMSDRMMGVVKQDPTCAKVALTGPVDLVPASGQREAAELLFARHPAMKLWPSGHDFRM